MLRIVLMGGGSGISAILRDLKNFQNLEIFSISTATDDGGSTGKILKIYDDIIPLGDMRNCLASLAEDKTLESLFQYRFDRAEFKEHALGNLILLALYHLSNKDIGEFTNKIHQIFKIKGKAMVSCKKRATLVAKMENGQIIKGETFINEFINKTNLKIEKVFLEGIEDKDVNPLALEAIKKADIIIIGPGSIYSSIIPNFLVKPLLEEYRKSKALKFYIANLVNQPNEFLSTNLSEYIKILKTYGIESQWILFNNKPIPSELIKKYKEKDPKYDVLKNDLNKNLNKDLKNEKVIEDDFLCDNTQNLENSQ
ncbi:MAG: uridine diphosphate-N-acetylglucosamine-binding protein YvcK, partial [bacterium]